MEIKHPIYPLPEVVPGEQGRGWRIRGDRRGRGIDFAQKVIRAPLDDSEVAHCVRMQQVGRIRWDDPEVRLTEDLEKSLLYQAVEHNRISCLLRRAGVDISAGFFNEEQLEMIRNLSGDAGRLAGMLLTDYTDEGPSPRLLSDFPRRRSVQLFTEVRRRVQEDPTKANAVRILGWLRTVVRDTQLTLNRNGKGIFCFLEGGAEDIAACDGDFEDYFEMAWEELEEDDRLQEIPAAVRDQLPRELSGKLAESSKKLWDQACNFVPWGTLRVQEPPRTHSFSGKFLKKWKPIEEGVFPRYPHRLLVDGRIFARRCKLPGGTVVIDASGSMRLTAAQIQAIVDCAPGCLVASYSGTGPGGVLRVLAKGGMRVAKEYCAPPGGGGNIVDFPALKWAYRHSHPRIWVSDQVVTGVNDQPGTGNLAMCTAAVKKGRFFTAHNVPEAVAVLRRLGRYYRKG